MKARRHHYVPEWYQRQFIQASSNDDNHWYLDLAPEKKSRPDGTHYFLKDLRRRGPNECFQEKNLYRLRFEQEVSDAIEDKYFGRIDHIGAPAVVALANFRPRASGRFINDFLRYLDAQKLRTPKGLDYIKALAKTEAHQSALLIMQNLSEVHCTMWMEAVWEIFRCDHTTTKFIISDHPVTMYNRQFPPGTRGLSYPLDPSIDLIGTQTLFPLCPDRLLVLTNLQFARDHWINGATQRTNARPYGRTLKFLGEIRTGRQLNDSEVQTVNFILKRRARRFIAAAEEEWLYPERYIKKCRWADLGGKFFLRPDPRRIGFKGEMFVGNRDGSSWGVDEYGRAPGTEGYTRQRSAEWDAYVRTTQLWDRECGKSAGDASF